MSRDRSTILLLRNEATPGVVVIDHTAASRYESVGTYIHIIYPWSLFSEDFLLNVTCKDEDDSKTLKGKIEKILTSNEILNKTMKCLDETSTIIIEEKDKVHVILINTKKEEEEELKRSVEEIKKLKLKKRMENIEIKKEVKKMIKSIRKREEEEKKIN